MSRNIVLSVVKGIAIILMVVGHAEAPDFLTRWIYTFHMPVFFIAAGYFFSRRYLDDPWSFCAKRFRGLYIPFLKWSLVFLLLHNLWFHLGVLNEQFGNWTGGVTHPYTFHQAAQRLILIVTSMSGYDEFIAGAFWFFRGLLVASILFLVLYRIVDSHTKLGAGAAVTLICLAALAFNAFRLFNGLKIPFIPNGGLREVWGLFFFGVGVLYRRFEPRVKETWWLTAIYAAALCAATHLHCCGMNNTGKPVDLLTLPVTGTIGFLMLIYLSRHIAQSGGAIARILAYVGDNTLYIFIFHILAFKAISLVKVLWYGLDPGHIGCHMVIHYRNHEDLFWILYSLAGVALPLIGLRLWQMCPRPFRRNSPATA